MVGFAGEDIITQTCVLFCLTTARLVFSYTDRCNQAPFDARSRISNLRPKGQQEEMPLLQIQHGARHRLGGGIARRAVVGADRADAE
jgi:hypothetical protein